MGTSMNKEREERRSLKLWIIIGGLSLAFLLYGLTMFLVVGDKGPPGWDFGVVEDTPGKSVFSTIQQQPVGTKGPEEQHVAGRPSLADTPAKDKPER
jgi:hypothetical protein